MQIYLQTQRKKRLLKAGLILMFIIFCLISGSFKNSKRTSQSNKYLQSSSTIPTFSENVSHQNTTLYDSATAGSEKMNKESDNNSFLMQIDSENTSRCIKLPSKVRVLANKGQIKEMDFEDYVLCALLGEMPLNFEIEALMAQCVAIRSFTAYKTQKSTFSHPDADVCTDYRCCQSFKTISEKNTSTELIQKAEQAVNATRGIVAVFDGKPIEAVYHASSGYSTLSSKEVWGGDISYLTSVKAPKTELDISKKVKTITFDELSEKLSSKENNLLKCGKFGENLIIYENTDGLCESISISGKEFNSSEIKKALTLNSSDFTISKEGENVKITSFGNGHRVGMSQHGANILAQEGKSYIEILKYYYSGISLCFTE